MMKKVALTLFVVVTFVVYTLHQRSEGGRAVSRVAATAAGKTATSPSASPVTTTGVSSSSTATYKDGTYTGKSSDAFYGYVQIRATVTGGKLSDVTFLDYPQDRDNSVQINDTAMPILKQQAIQAQSAQVDGVSGATDTSQAFIESLSDALSQAKA